MYCEIHKQNNCLQCAIQEQTGQIVRAINMNRPVLNKGSINLWPVFCVVVAICLTLLEIFK